MKDEKRRMTASERRTILRHKIETQGLWNINKTALARELGVGESQIRRDVKQIIKKMPGDKVHEPVVELFNSYIQAQKEIRRMLNDGSRSQKIQAINTLLHLGDKFTKLMEDYGLKRKVPDEVKVTEFSLADAYEEEMKKEAEK